MGEEEKRFPGQNAPHPSQQGAGSDTYSVFPFPALSTLFHDRQPASHAKKEELLPFMPPRSSITSFPLLSSPVPFQKLPIKELTAEPEVADLSEPNQEQVEAENALQQAREEAEQIRQQAWQQGYQAGWQTGKEAAEVEQRTQREVIAQNLRREIETFLEDLTQQVEEYLARLEPHLLTLTLEIARKVVKDEIRQDPQVVLRIIQDALRRVGAGMKLRIRVNPLDLELARENKSSFLSLVEGLRQIEIIEDRRVEQGGCLIETDQGILDARPTTQLQEIEQALLHSSSAQGQATEVGTR